MTAKSVRSLLFLLIAGAAGTACRKPAAPEAAAEAAQPASEAGADHEALPQSVRLTPAAISEAGITTWKVQPVDLEHMLVLTGSVDYDENRLLQLAANVRGRAASIRVDLGDRVRKGDPILEIESVELGRAREELLRELSGLRVSARAFERARTLVEAKAISAGEFQAREGDYLAKKAAAEAAERALHLYGVPDEEISELRASIESGKVLSGHDVPRLILRAPFDRTGHRPQGHARGALRGVAAPGDGGGSLLGLGLPAGLREGPGPAARGRARDHQDRGLSSGGLRRARRLPGQRRGRDDSHRARARYRGQPRRETPARHVRQGDRCTCRSLRRRPRRRWLCRRPRSRRSKAGRRCSSRPRRASSCAASSRPGHTFEGFTEILSGAKPGEQIVSEGSFVLKSEFAKASLVEEE